MNAFIDPPKRILFFLRFGIWISRKVTKKEMLVAKLLSWYPKAAFGSAMLESFVAHHDKSISDRILKLIRMQASFATSCPFCIDMNSFEYGKLGISSRELSVLKNQSDTANVDTFTKREKLAVEYTRMISAAPLDFPAEFIRELKEEFTNRDIVILASTSAQVNYWARLCSALGVPPAGFTEECNIGHMDP